MARPVPCRQLAADGNLPERFLLHILRDLVNHGLLRSTRGVDGGYALIRSPHDVTLLEIIEAVEGPMDMVEQQPTSPTPLSEDDAQTHKRLQSALRGVSATVRKELAAIKLSHLLQPPKAD